MQNPTLKKKIITLRNQLVDRFVGREDEVTAVLSSLFSGEPAILVGPPGTAKTALIESVAKLMSGRYFYYLLTRFTEPDELLGPLDIKALREGQYKRITTGRLPEAEIVFLDEIFKASSAVRNILLDIILNKRYLNGNGYVKLPMLTLYTASNEISTDEEDAAFYDRLTIRRFLSYVSADMWGELLDLGVRLEFGDGLQPVMSVDDVRLIQRTVIRRMKETYTNIKNKYLEALAVAKEKGVEISDRRKVKVLRVAAAISVLYLEDTMTPDDVADALRFCAVFDGDDLKKVEDVIESVGLMTYQEKVMKWMTLASELRNALKALDERKDMESLSTAVTLFKRLRAELKNAPKSPRLLRYVKEIKSLLLEAREKILKVKEELDRALEG